MDITPDPSYYRAMDPDMALGSDLSMASGSTSYPDQYDSCRGMVLRHQGGLRWLTRLQPCAWLLVVAGTIDIDSDPGCCRAIDADMALSSSLSLDDTMAPVIAQAMSNSMALAVASPSDIHLAVVVAPTLGIHVVSGGLMGHRHQYRAWLKQSHGPRHAPREEPGFRCHYGPRWLYKPRGSVWPPSSMGPDIKYPWHLHGL